MLAGNGVFRHVMKSQNEISLNWGREKIFFYSVRKACNFKLKNGIGIFTDSVENSQKMKLANRGFCVFYGRKEISLQCQKHT